MIDLRKIRITGVGVAMASLLALTSGVSAQVQSDRRAPVQKTGQLHTTATPAARVLKTVDNSKRLTLPGHVSRMVRQSADVGRVATTTRAEDMVMVLKSSDEQIHELHQVLDQQQDKSSANYHQWVTPEQFGEHFGVHDADIAKVSAWLESQGFTVNDVSKSKRVLHFSGTTGQIERAFQTEMHHYKTLSGEAHVANNSDITVPEALSPVIAGVTLNNFFRTGHMGPRTSVKAPATAKPLYTSSSTTHYVGPWDFATIYNTFPLLNKGITGAGSSIAVVGRSDILLSDVQNYRTLFDLPNNDPIFIHAGQDNGTQPGDDGESDLDVEISGGIAPNAQLYFVIGTPTFLVDGITNSVQYIVENNTADIMSISYGSCESVEGAGGNEFNNQAFEQAAAQGISVFVAAGDNGPAECDNQNDSWEVYGYSTGGESSTPYSVSVGGSQGFEASSYWNSTTQLTAPYWGLSALSYIPEVPWNESKVANKSLDTSGLAGLWSGSGGISSYYMQPSWQRGSGISATDPAYTNGGNWVTSINITNGGSGYTATPTVTATGGGCTAEPTVIATLASGAVSSVTFQYFNASGTEKTGQGFGCTSVPTLAFTAAPAGGTTATATAVIGPMVNTPPLVTGVPHRLTPDLVLNAASGHDGTIFCSEGECANGYLGLVGGTSVAAPSMAGIQALINQANGGRQGMPGYIYYALSAAQNETNCNSTTPPAVGAGCAFQDITQGDNLICGLSTCTATATTTQKMGWAAGTGYDLATGLGSVNAYNMATQWSSVVFNSSATTLNLSQTTGIAQGTPVTISGTVAATSGSGTPTGNVAFILSKGAIGQTLDVTGDANDGAFNGPTAVATLGAGGTYTATLPNLPGGSYTVTARYGGDGTYASSLSTPVPVSVNAGNDTITITPSLVNLSACTFGPTNAFTYGSPAYVTVNIAATSGAGVPTGNATITVDGVAWGTEPIDPSGNVYLIAGNYGTAANSCLYDYLFSQGPFLQGGTHTIGATYAGDSTFNAVTAAPVTVTVSPLSVVPTLAVGAQTITSGFTTPLTATFSVTALSSGSATAASGPTGTVTFTDTTTGTSLGTATVVPNFTYSVTATSTSSYPSYTYGATAAGSTTGITTAGANVVTAVYSGDANYAAATSTATTVTVSATTPVATTTTITSSANPTTINGRPTLTATIGAASGTAPTTGTVSFYDGSIFLGTGTVGAAHTTTYRPATTYAFTGGAHSITAVYGGIAANAPSTSAVFTQNVTKGTGTFGFYDAKAAGLVGQTFTFAVVLTPSSTSSVYTPTLAPVQFYDGTTLIGSAYAQTINEAQGGYGNWTATFATTSLAAGTHSITAQYSDVNYTFTNSAASTVKVYSSPVGNIDLAVGAQSGTTTIPQSDSLYVGGWAADPVDGSPLTQVVVYIDGVAVATPTLNISRPDVATSQNNTNYAKSGFAGFYSAANLALGAHKVTVSATDSYGLTTYFQTVNFTVVGGYKTPVGNIDTVVGAATGNTTIPQSDSLYVSGWAADPSGAALTNVAVYVDGTVVGTTTATGSRPDVTAYPHSGFVFTYPATTLSIGSHTVTVSATNQAGVAAFFQTFTINVAAPYKAPTGNFDEAVDSASGGSPVHTSNYLYMQGWAADYQADGQVASVTVVIDGNVSGTATLGQSRPDVATANSDPNWGTTGWVYVIPAAGLSIGNHTVKAYATDHTGLITWLNAITINVVTP